MNFVEISLAARLAKKEGKFVNELLYTI